VEETTTTCYRHPNREAPLRCTRCERPICLDDAIDAPVGFLCPDDAQQAPRVQRVSRAAGAPVTRLLVGLLVGVYVIQQVGGPSIELQGLTWGRAIAVRDEPYRIVTGAFLHANLLHIGFNGYLLWQLGHMLEPAMGRARFLGVYVAGLAGGSAGVLLLSWDAPTLGASGAVFGLMGAALVLLRRAGVDPWQTSIGSLVVLNVVLTFVIPGISIGGHVGGLLGGAAAAATLVGRRDEASGMADAMPWVVAGGLLALAWYAGTAGPLLPDIPLLS
jgi:membrane associated rhomboid family serine protease